MSLKSNWPGRLKPSKINIQTNDDCGGVLIANNILMFTVTVDHIIIKEKWSEDNSPPVT